MRIRLINNIFAPDENSILKLIETVFTLMGIIFIYFFVLPNENDTYDLRFVTKYMGWFFGYFFLTRTFTKAYLYYTDNPETNTVKNE